MRNRPFPSLALLSLAMAVCPPLAHAQSSAVTVQGELPLTPVIGVDPTALEFGVVCQGDCANLELAIRNAVDDPESQLIVSGLAATSPFSVVNPPPLPFSIPGDGTEVSITVRYCATAVGSQTGSLIITAPNARNSPLDVSLRGSGDPPPLCDAGGPYSSHLSQPITFDGSDSSDPGGVITSYAWDFGDGTTATGAVVQHTYGDFGTYQATLQVTDGCESTASCQTTATVVNTLPICDAGGPYQGTVGQPITFDGTGSTDPDGKIVTYEWQFGDCGTGTGASPTHTYGTAASYEVQLCVTDDEGGTSCCSVETVVQNGAGPAMRSGIFGKQTAGAQSTGVNPMFTLPLHAVPGCQDCSSLLINCGTMRPTVTIPPNLQITIYVLANNHTALTGVQSAFEWPASWLLLGAIFDCLPGQLTVLTPTSPGGATAGTMATSFNCVSTGQLLIIGRLLMKAGSSGCLIQVQSTHPNGIHAVDCSLGINQIPTSEEFRLGKICIGPGGVDACDPGSPVEATTWGQIKASYR